MVHHQAPARLEAECVVPLRIETCLIDPGDDDTTYLELRMRDLTLRDQFYGLLTLDTARQLRDQAMLEVSRAQRAISCAAICGPGTSNEFPDSRRQGG